MKLDTLKLGMICLTVIICVWIHADYTRYVWHPMEAYRLDRKTGQTWDAR